MSECVLCPRLTGSTHSHAARASSFIVLLLHNAHIKHTPLQQQRLSIFTPPSAAAATIMQEIMITSHAFIMPLPVKNAPSFPRDSPSLSHLSLPGNFQSRDQKRKPLQKHPPRSLAVSISSQLCDPGECDMCHVWQCVRERDRKIDLWRRFSPRSSPLEPAAVAVSNSTHTSPLSPFEASSNRTTTLFSP